MDYRKCRRSRAMAEALEPRRLLSAQLIKDINTMKPGADFPPAYITPAGSIAYLTDDDGVTGEEVWKTDGTSADTSLVKDINPGGAPSYPGGYTTLGNITYFGAQEPADGNELWRTDGTAAGTYLVKDINPGTASSNPSGFTAYNGLLYFFADDGTHGRELWESDGTTGGTNLVSDIYPGSGGQATDALTFHRIVVGGNNVLFFTALDGTNNNLYTITGNSAPVKVKQLAYYITGPGLLAGTGNLVFYSDILGYVYQSDGTASGTVTDDSTNSTVTNLTIGGSYLYYVRNGLIKCVGGGTIQPVTTSTLASPTIIGASGSDVYFSVYQSGTPQVWYAYGGGQFSGLVLSNATGTTGTTVGSLFYFVTGTSTAGYSLYKVAAPPASATFISTINTGGSLSAPTGLAGLGSKLLFVNTDQTNGTQPWVSDGTSAGTHLVQAVYPGTAGSFPFTDAVVNGRVFFTANDGITGTEPYVTDGTSAGTVELKDISPGANSSSSSVSTLVVGTKLYFSDFDPTDGYGIWVTDGTPAGTSLLFATGSTSIAPYPIAFVNGWLLFAANDSTHGTELWRSDGTTANTRFLDDINPGTSSSNPTHAVVMNGYAYFAATDATHGTELWRSDGTATGTSLVDDIYPGSISSGVSASLFVYRNTLLFSAESTASTGYELWKSDGTAAGTTLVKDLYPGSASSTPSGFALFNGLVYFKATDATTAGVWVTDGTVAGTSLIAEDNPTNLTAMNGKLYFSGFVVGQTTRNLFSSMGTSGTTMTVGPIFNTLSSGMVSIGGRLFFTADDGTGAGVELWSSDGITTGTAMVQDLFPGSLSGASTPLIGLNSAVIFQGDNGVTGRELYQVPDTYPPELYAAAANVAASTHTISFSFSENVSANLSAAALQLQDLTSGQTVTVAPSGYSYNSSSNTATLTLPDAALADGRYRATLPASDIIDPQGNVATSAATLEFLSVAGVSGNNAISIQPSTDGNSLLVYKGAALTFTTPLASLGSVVVTGGAGNDSLSVSLGSLLPPGGFWFDGGGGSNSIFVKGSPGTHAVTASTGLFTYDTVPISYFNSGPVTFDATGESDAVSDSGQLAFASAQGVARNVPSLNLTGALDVNDNSLDLAGASLASLNSLAQSGYNTGLWNGTGLASSAAAGDVSRLTALAVIQNNQGGTPLFTSAKPFDGITPGTTDVLVKYTWYGDSNLDGKVDGSDYSRIDASYLSHGSLTGWYNGDFNYDGAIDGSDYTLIDNAFNRQGTGLAAQIATPAAQINGACALTARNIGDHPALFSQLPIAPIGQPLPATYALSVADSIFSASPGEPNMGIRSTRRIWQLINPIA